MTIPIWQVDAFADRPFSGNPAAVCLVPKWPDTQWMQSVAEEMRLSETAFLVPVQTREFGLRWFTPTTEVDLCGHATLASLHVLLEREPGASTTCIRFQTRSGLLTCERRDGKLTLDFPATPIISEASGSEADLLCESLGCSPEFIGRTKYDLMAVLRDASAVERLQPNFERLSRLETRGVIVTAALERDGVDFISRFFAPGAGIDEDPVTGSAHCALGPYWASRFGRHRLVGYQASQRGGLVGTDSQRDRVLLSGKAITIAQGVLTSAAIADIRYVSSDASDNVNYSN